MWIWHTKYSELLWAQFKFLFFNWFNYFREETKINQYLEHFIIDSSLKSSVQVYRFNINQIVINMTTDEDEQWENQIKEIFQVYDKKSSGTMAGEDLADAIRSCGIRVTNQQLDLLSNEAQLKSNGNISFALFSEFVHRASEIEIRDSQIQSSFAMFVDDSGYIHMDKFRHALMTLGDRLSKDEMDTVLKDAGFDPKTDTTIHYQKILALVQNNVF